MRVIILATVALACTWLAANSAEEQAAQTGAMPSADEMAAAMRRVHIADDAESLIRSAIEGAERSDLTVQRVDRHSSPFDYERGDGTAIFIGKPLKDMDPATVKQPYSLVLWIMPPAYEGH